jgi:hypothetical protein
VRAPLGLRLWFLALVASLVAIAAASCGARTGLPVDDRPERDAAPDAEEDAGPDAEDAGPDVVDAPPDVPPPPIICEDAGITYIYLITVENDLYHFYPPDLSFAKNGTIDCTLGPTPYSMAVDRAGTAYVLFNNGELFEVSTANAACDTTDFVPGQDNFSVLFGMGFSSNKDDPGETLFIAGQEPGRLGIIDPFTMELTTVGAFDKNIGNAELTGTGDARLFAFGVDNPNAVIHLAEIEKETAKVLSDETIDFPASIGAWAFAFWGGDFYFFISTQGGFSDVFRYHPEDKSFTQVTSLDRTIVGAGVSTCAPH